MHKTSASAAGCKQNDTAELIIHHGRSKYATLRKLNAGQSTEMRASQGTEQNTIIERKPNNIQILLRQSALQPTNFQPKLLV